MLLMLVVTTTTTTMMMMLVFWVSQTVREDSGGRHGRFLSWGSVTRSPHPTMASFTQRASQLGDILRRAAKFLSAFASAQVSRVTLLFFQRHKRDNPEIVV